MSMRQIAYDIYLSQPVKITNIAIGKEGEMETLSYIPGSTMRGAVMSKMADLLKVPEKKQVLLSEHVQFLNAYPVCKGKQMFPVVKGFYEGKLSDGTLECVLGEKDPTPGFKRASLGEFCCVENGTIRYMGVRKKEVLSNNIGQNKVFRSVTLEAGQTFRGYVSLEENIGKADAVVKAIMDVLKCGGLFIGSGKTSGYGEVEIRNVEEISSLPEFMPKIKKPVKEATMILLSPMSMRNAYGEICGLDETILAKMLGIVSVKVLKASTSAIKVSGVNRTWGCRTPETVMYQSGSVFRLSFSEPVAPEKLALIAQQGLGINRAEGCGRICFTDCYDKITKKEELSPELPQMTGIYCSHLHKKESLKSKEAAPGTSSGEIDLLKRRLAKRIALGKIETAMQTWIVNDTDDPWQKMSHSQRGIVLNFMKNICYQKSGAKGELQNYIDHEKEKLKKSKKQSTSDNGKEQMLTQLGQLVAGNIFEELKLTNVCIMGYSIEELFASDRAKQELYFKFVENQIRYSARRAKEGD